MDVIRKITFKWYTIHDVCRYLYIYVYIYMCVFCMHLVSNMSVQLMVLMPKDLGHHWGNGG
jgi:hypothetical protein